MIFDNVTIASSSVTRSEISDFRSLKEGREEGRVYLAPRNAIFHVGLSDGGGGQRGVQGGWLRGGWKDVSPECR